MRCELYAHNELCTAVRNLGRLGDLNQDNCLHDFNALRSYPTRNNQVLCRREGLGRRLEADGSLPWLLHSCCSDRAQPDYMTLCHRSSTEEALALL